MDVFAMARLILAEMFVLTEGWRIKPPSGPTRFERGQEQKQQTKGAKYENSHTRHRPLRATRGQ